MEDLSTARPPVSADEVEELLRTLCDALEKEAGEAEDPILSDEQERLIEAWRVYQRRISASEVSGGGRPRRATMAVIDYALERLREYGCFVRVEHDGHVLWQPTRRYNVMVQELAATVMFQEVERLLGDEDAL